MINPASFTGRALRSEFWVVGVMVTIANLIVVVFMEVGLSRAALLPVATLFWLLQAAVCIRRLHDRNRSGWWLLIFWVAPFLLILPWDIAIARMEAGTLPPLGWLAVVPGIVGAAIGLWGFVEMALLPGTPGENRFGADPRIARPN